MARLEVIASDSAAVVEFQALRGLRNDYIIKELAVVDLSTQCFNVTFFAPPYEKSRLDENIVRSNEWSTRHYHRLRWNEGYIPYTDMPLTLVEICSHVSTICLLYTSRCV